jgi:hypothetical protein
MIAAADGKFGNQLRPITCAHTLHSGDPCVTSITYVRRVQKIRYITNLCHHVLKASAIDTGISFCLANAEHLRWVSESCAHVRYVCSSHLCRELPFIESFVYFTDARWCHQSSFERRLPAVADLLIMFSSFKTPNCWTAYILVNKAGWFGFRKGRYSS